MKHTFLLASFVVCSTILALGQTAGLVVPTVTFQATTQSAAGSKLYLKGNVQIQNAKRSLQADEVEYNVTTGDIVARGNVRISTEDGLIQAEVAAGTLAGINQWQVKGAKK